MNVYFDKFNMQFTDKKDEFAAPERYVEYDHDNESGKLSEVHIVGSNGNSITFEYDASETVDPVKLDKKRVRFFEDNGYDDYDANPNKYYTTHMVVSKNEYDKIIKRIRGEL